MLTSRDYEFVRVFESLTWIGLQYYAYRLYQFESVRQDFEEEPEKLVRKGSRDYQSCCWSQSPK